MISTSIRNVVITVVAAVADHILERLVEVTDLVNHETEIRDKKHSNKKAMVAMSGGVDSSTVALILREQGYEVIGVTGRMFVNEDIGLVEESRCCSLADVEDARLAAHKIGAPHYVYNMGDSFKKTVIQPFVDAYLTGNTPNPCVNCNKYVKFPQLLERALMLGIDYLATGHYAKVFFDQARNRWLLARAEDESKDQTYMLYGLTQHELSHLLLPLGNFKKTEVRLRAGEAGLINASKPDSQDICFVPDGNYAEFIERYSGKKQQPGKFILQSGEVIGRHKGLIHYTLGQRKGLGIAYKEPLYVLAKDADSNTVVLGSEKDLYKKEFLVGECNFILIEELTAPMNVTCKVRYRMQDEPAIIEPVAAGKVKVTFRNAQRAITSGQAAVFYDENLVVGGGTIIAD
jgi:tRNA-specific 2-thiouridylase